MHGLDKTRLLNSLTASAPRNTNINNFYLLKMHSHKLVVPVKPFFNIGSFNVTFIAFSGISLVSFFML